MNYMGKLAYNVNAFNNKCVLARVISQFVCNPVWWYLVLVLVQLSKCFL